MLVAEYFDSVADDYRRHYDSDWMDTSIPYPANKIRRELLFDVFKDVTNPIDVGGGDGTILEHWDFGCGFDIAPKMAELGNKKHGSRFIQADIMKPETYAKLVERYGPFDGLIAMGVMPHIEDTYKALRNMKNLVHGKVFIEFRNSLFSMFTFNKYTVEFVTDMVHPIYRDLVRSKLKAILPDVPAERPYDKILSKFHNPFEVEDMFRIMGFVDIRLHWYHYHPAPPWMSEDEKLFRKTALEMEGKPDWKSPFICSAFVVEADYE